MLRQLRINNVILVEEATANFGEGFNVVSGETGSGKSAIMEALAVVMGQRADSGIVRHGAKKAVIEALFDVSDVASLAEILDDAGIDHGDDQLIVRREIAAAGKSRALINNQLAHLTLLRRVGDCLVDIVGQHANQRLLSLEYHRDVVDTFGGLQAIKNTFAHSWSEQRRLGEELDALIASEAQRLRDIERYRREVEELRAAALHDDEEEALFAEYSVMTHAEELAQKAHILSGALSGAEGSAIAILSQQQATVDRLVELAPSLTETAEALKSAMMELGEVDYAVQTFASSLEYDPHRLEEVNDRLTIIHQLKRKYGPTVSDVEAYHANAREQLDRLDNAETHIEELKGQVQEAQQRVDALAAQLTQERQRAAQALQQEVVATLQGLNMGQALFEVQVSPQQRSSTGDDRVEFLLAPNVGEKTIPVKECASGGELSRLMLTIKRLLAGKDNTPTLIFDEIDANIGGQTATIVGQRLKEIAQGHQVVCITHFPQVARYADHHLQITKTEAGGRTLTTIATLDKEHRHHELTRMLGGSALPSTSG